jgi:hypothetical protein
LGWSEGNVKKYIREMIAQFSLQYEVQISGIAATVELNPSLCPLVPCPLKISQVGAGEAGVKG